MPASRAVLLAAVIVALALIASALIVSRQHYALAQGADGVVVRLDTRSGETAACMMGRSRESGTTVYTFPCDGVKHD